MEIVNIMRWLKKMILANLLALFLSFNDIQLPLTSHFAQSKTVNAVVKWMNIYQKRKDTYKSTYLHVRMNLYKSSYV